MDDTERPAAIDEALTAEALRLNARFVDEVVESLNVCPWARPARHEGEVRRLVWLNPIDVGAAHTEHAVDEALAACIHEVEADAATVVTLLICPRARASARGWTDFAETVRRRVLEAPGKDRTLAIAPFHPELPYRTDRPSAMVPLFRRSPDPTLQLVRLDVLRALSEKTGGEDRYASAEEVERILRGEIPPPKPTHAERVARANYETARHMGLDELLRAIDDIIEDRRRSYVALAKRFGVEAI